MKSRPNTKRRDDVLRGAAECFRDQGYEGTSIQDIADRVGMLKGSLYHYISSKEDLLYEIISSAHQVALDLIGEANAQTDLAAADKIVWLMRRQVERNMRMLHLAAIFHTEVRHLPPPRRREIYKTRAAFEQLFTGLVAQAQRDGAVPSTMPPDLLARVVLASLNSLQLWFDPDHSPFGPGDTAQTYLDILTVGLFGRPIAPDDAVGDQR